MVGFNDFYEIVSYPLRDWLGFCLVMTALFLWSWSALLSKYKYPPGPIPLPLISSSYHMLERCKASYRFKNWRKYGTVVSYHSLGVWNVELFGHEAIHEAFVTHANSFSERKFVDIFKDELKPGIDGEHWRELRRQALVVLRDHGMGRAAIDDTIRGELEYTFDVLSSRLGRQTSEDFKSTIGKVVANIINQVLFGHRLDYKDPVFDSLCHYDAYFLARIKSSTLPFYKHWPWDPLKLAYHAQHFKRAFAFFKSEIELHRAALDADQPKDYIDSYLAEGIKKGQPIFCDEEMLLSTINQLYIGGFDTTSTTLTWAVLFMINHPDSQRRLYDEIHQVIGDRPVTSADGAAMHYTQSFIHEVQRASSMACASLMRQCTADTVIQGRLIPKGTMVHANLHSTYYDEKVFPDSYAFKPERFLDAEGEFCKATGKQMLAFSIGKRACLGESLARTELFMILVSFVQRFQVERTTEELVCETGIDVFTHTAEPFVFNLSLRS